MNLPTILPAALLLLFATAGPARSAGAEEVVPEAAPTAEGAAADEAEAAPAEPGPERPKKWKRRRKPRLPKGKGQFALTGRLEGRGELMSDLPTDAAGSVLEGGLGLDPRLRLSLAISHAGPTLRLSLAAEGDLSGEVVGQPELEGEGLPRTQGFDLRPRKAFVAAQGRSYRVAAGLMTSHWGLGLLANDGDHGWTPSSARFTDPRGGDTVWRAMVTVAANEDLAFTLAADRVYQDDTTLEGDVAWQGVLAATYGSPASPGAGLYLVYRHLEAASGGTLEVVVVDALARTTIDLSPELRLSLATEVALIAGNTTLAPSVDFRRHRVLQAGGVLRASLEAEGWGVVTDLVLASGDQNLDDVSQNAFKADVNFHQGMLLYQWALAGQTGRSVATASDLELVGQPASDLERLPTRGSVTNSAALFPRGYYRLSSIPLEVFGGPLLAFGVVPTVDPYNTRMAGGSLRNALDGPGSTFLGVELDAGARYHRIFRGIQMAVGLEAAMLVPGKALQGPDGAGKDLLFGGRLTLSIGL